LAWRSNSATPIRSSSSFTRRLTAAGVTCSSAAAATKLPARAAASKARMPFRKGGKAGARSVVAASGKLSLSARKSRLRRAPAGCKQNRKEA
jgi:hypothetical protein